MRFAFVPFVILAASFSLVAAQTATVPPDVAPNKIDMSKPPAPPSNVNVLNFPEVQAVEGTVSVGNLPLDVDGALRVTSAPTREPALLELVPGGVTVESMTTYLSPIVDTAGYSKIGINFVGNFYIVEPLWRWAGAPLDDFARVVNWGEAHNPPADCLAPHSGERHICLVSGAQLRFRIDNGGNGPGRIESLRVYLIP